MHEFIAKHEDQITGTLSGFDRLVFPGTLRSIAHGEGTRRFLWANQVLRKDSRTHVEFHRNRDLQAIFFPRS